MTPISPQQVITDDHCCLQVSSYKFPRLKEVDDVLGGAAAWENVDSTEGLYLNLLVPVL